MAAKTGKPVEFNFENMGFNMDADAAISTKQWPLGRLSADIRGKISVRPDGSYTVHGTAKMDSDTYSWEADGTSPWHNRGIEWLGGSFNGPARGDMLHSSLASRWAFSGNNDPGISGTKLIGGPPEGSVEWNRPSQMLSAPRLDVHYNRTYDFSAWGTAN